MTDPNYTHVTLLVDSSGSMFPKREATIKGYNDFIATQRESDGSCSVSTILFSYETEPLHEFQTVETIPLLTNEVYKPSGGTALQDALARSILALGTSLHNLPEEARPSKVLFLLLTDGEENASVFFDGTKGMQKLKEMIEHQQSIYNWEFVFMGTSSKSIEYAKQLGILNTQQYADTAEDTLESWKTLSMNTLSYRSDSYSKGTFFNQ